MVSPVFHPVRLEVYKHLFSSIAEEMGVVLRKASYSPNIKERRDFSCAIFDVNGNMIAQAAHIPVHLGSMSISVSTAIREIDVIKQGDVIILNDPYRGGTHLPDITLITPVYTQVNSVDHLFGFVASRAHHADVGGMTPGSMPVAQEIFQEGLIIPPVKLIAEGQLNQAIVDIMLANVRTPGERSGDLWAQLASNERGVKRLHDAISRYGFTELTRYMQYLLEYTEKMTCQLLENIPDGTFKFTDYLDDDGIRDKPIQISVTICINGSKATVDFSGSSHQVSGSMNAVYAITLSAVFYVFRSLFGLDIPNNSGCLKPITVNAPEGTVVNATHPAPVAGGNVETSQRIVDVLLGALSQAIPEKIPAASQGTMNNIAIGGWDPLGSASFSYYETIGGGMGARPESDGPAAVHSHMTNTLNTPIEALEYTTPLQILRYEIRRNTGGDGRYKGGDGMRRDIQVLSNATVSIISERRHIQPYGLFGGKPGVGGRNVLIRGGDEEELPGKCSFVADKGDIISIQTPGGGGYGEP